jgi:competence protein ComEC
MLTIHFLNVGHGDCTVISHPSGRLSVLDINNAPQMDPTSLSELGAYYHGSAGYSFLEYLYPQFQMDKLRRSGYGVSLTNPVQFLMYSYPGQPIFRYIQTHPDMDHMRGLVALRQRGFSILNLWDTNYDKRPEHFRESDEQEWSEYVRLRSGMAGAGVLYLYRGDRGPYYNMPDVHGSPSDEIEILAPTPELIENARRAGNTNDYSYVIRISYGGRRIILGGDAERATWDSIVQHYGADLQCDILKASHHGRVSGYHREAVRLMRPTITVVSVGKKPDTDATNKYRQYSDEVWSTRWCGTITFQIDVFGKMYYTTEQQH